MRAREFIVEDKDFNEPVEIKKQKNLIPWPAGTVRIEVSDVYDWHKLGMIISDLDDADPKDFGKGPPSTVIAFGSEEEEKKLMPLLKRLKLKIHDIDQPTEIKEAYLARDLIKTLNEKNAADYHYGIDPAQLSYTFKVGDIYGPKNLKVPHARLYRSGKAVKSLGISKSKVKK